MSDLSTHADGRPYGMGKKSYVKLLDQRGFREWVAERNITAGTEDSDKGAMSFICAQVCGRATLKQISDHYVIDYGLLWDFVNETPARKERYHAAQRGMAEFMAGETLEIVDRTDPEFVAVSKLQVDQRNKLMKAWNKERYGDAEAQLGAGMENLAAVLQRISERKMRPATAPEIEDAQIVEKQPLPIAFSEADIQQFSPVKMTDLTDIPESDLL